MGRHNYVATLAPVSAEGQVAGGLVMRCVDVTGVCRPARVEAQLMSVAAHEMRTPLTSILGYSELIMNRADPESRALQHAKAIRRQAARLEAIVSELLTVTRLQAGREELVVEPFDLSLLVTHLVESAQPLAAEKSITLTPAGADREHMVRGDVLKLERVVENLVGNALKYSPDGASVRVTARSGAGRAEIEVADTGHGIPAEDAPHVFEKFYRARSRYVEGVEGTGLGLAIAKLIVEAHGGEMSLKTTEGKGSTFTVSLPVAGPPAAHVEALTVRDAQPTPAAAPETIHDVG